MNEIETMKMNLQASLELASYLMENFLMEDLKNSNIDSKKKMSLEFELSNAIDNFKKTINEINPLMDNKEFLEKLDKILKNTDIQTLIDDLNYEHSKTLLGKVDAAVKFVKDFVKEIQNAQSEFPELLESLNTEKKPKKITPYDALKRP